MARRHLLRVGALMWALLGAVVAPTSLQSVEDARLLVGIASILGPLVAVWAERRLSWRADRSAGLLLAVSAVLTPTYFAYVTNLPALVVGLVLVAAPHVVLPPATGRPRGACPRVSGRDADHACRSPDRRPPLDANGTCV